MIIVTGGAGFIGSALIAELNACGEENIVVVDGELNALKNKNLAGKKFRSYFHKTEFLDLVDGTLMGKAKAIFHLGACSSTTETNLEYLKQNNTEYTKKLTNWALEQGTQFIYASSAATYGAGADGFADQHSKIEQLKPLNAYAQSKQNFDSWALNQNLLDQITGIKFFNIFGPNEYHKGPMRSVVYKSFHQIQNSGCVKLFKSYLPAYADGEQQRDFLYVKDCAKVMLWLLNNPQVKGIFNLGSGQAQSWNQLARAVFSASRKPEKIEYIEMPEHLRQQYQYFTEAPMQKLRAAGYSAPFTPLETAVADYVQNYLEKNEACF
ncbi:ADP-glyceromanno-heptose 6-epimerase [bacterium]|nr:ADP-glyceromanno-heptose 6-epimerase [bacterium]